MDGNSSNTNLNFLQKSVTYTEQVIFYGQFPEFISKSFVDIRNNSGSYCVVDDLQDTKNVTKYVLLHTERNSSTLQSKGVTVL